MAMTELLYHLGLVYEDQGDVKKATSALKRARKLVVEASMTINVVDALTRLGSK